MTGSPPPFWKRPRNVALLLAAVAAVAAVAGYEAGKEAGRRPPQVFINLSAQ